MLERATCVLNLASAVILLIAGFYIQVVFSSFLPAVLKLFIGVSVVGYFMLRLDIMSRRE